MILKIDLDYKINKNATNNNQNNSRHYLIIKFLTTNIIINNQAANRSFYKNILQNILIW